MESYKLTNGKTLEVFLDEYPQNPREDDNLTTMICFHKRYNLGDKHDYQHRDYSGWEEQRKDIEKKENTCVILPLYLYDHSGITISTSPFSCNFDSGKIGFVIVDKDNLQKMTGDADGHTEENLNQIIDNHLILS